MKRILLLVFLIASCATEKVIIHKEHKVVIDKLIVGRHLVLRLDDESCVIVDSNLWFNTQVGNTVVVKWEKKGE